MQIGHWTTKGGLSLANAQSLKFMGGQSTVADFVSALKGKHIKITTIREQPFVMFKHDNYNPMDLKADVDVEGKIL